MKQVLIMTDIFHTGKKSDKQVFFEVQVNWLEENKGLLSADDITHPVTVALPPEFGGEGKEWSPEHLFLSALTSSYMTTFLTFSRKLGFELFQFECSAIGQVEIVEGQYAFTTINLYPRIFITNENARELAASAMEKTRKSCLVANSIQARIIYHGEIKLHHLLNNSQEDQF
jgi:organic hydroperoxide reductase OsmC/OhrA